MAKALIKIFSLFCFFILFFCGPLPAQVKVERTCQECHSQKFLRQHFSGFPEDIYNFQSIYQAQADPCPGIQTLATELFLAESRLQKLAEIVHSPPKDNLWPNDLKRKIYEVAGDYAYFKSKKISSGGEFAKEISSLRSSLNQVYERIWQIREENNKRWLIGIGSLIFLVFLAICWIGLQKVSRWGKISGLLIFIIASFSWISCLQKSGEIKKSPAEQQLQQTIAILNKRGQEFAESTQRVFLLITLAKNLTEIDGQGARQTWDLAWNLATSLAEHNRELIALEELTQSLSRSDLSSAQIRKASLWELQEKIRQLRHWVFPMRVVAEEWLLVDQKEGRRALAKVTERVLSWPAGENRDRELKALGEVWSEVEKEKALKLVYEIKDPFGRAFALARLAGQFSEKERAQALLKKAAQEITLLSPPFRQVQSQVRLAAIAAQIDLQKGRKWAEQAFLKIKELPEKQLQSWALQEMIRRWALWQPSQAEEWIGKIPVDFSESHAYSYLSLAQNNSLPAPSRLKFLRQALRASKEIVDPWERQKLESMILPKMYILDKGEALRNLGQVKDPLWRSAIEHKILREYAHLNKNQALPLAQNIPCLEFRLPLIIELMKELIPAQREELLKLYQETFQVAAQIWQPDQRSQVLIELAEKWGRLDRKAQSACLQEAEKSMSQISSPWKKAETLRSLSQSWKNIDHLKSINLFEKIDPSAHQAQKLLEEIRLWGKLNPQKAADLAKAIPAGFPFEKTQAYKELAVLLKKDNPAQAWAYLEAAVQEIIPLAADKRVFPLLGQLINEAVNQDRKKIHELISKIPERNLRDLAWRELAKALLKNKAIPDLKEALQIAAQISDSSLSLELLAKMASILNEKKLAESSEPALLALYYWSINKEKAEKVILTIPEASLRSRLLAALAVSWAPINEEKALQIAEKISAEYPEAYSYALLKVGEQLRKWHRNKGESVLRQAGAAAEKIFDPTLKTERIHRLIQEIHFLNPTLAQALLQKTRKEIPSAKDLFLFTLIEWNPELVREAVKEASQPYLQGQLLLKGAEILYQRRWAEYLKILETIWQIARERKNSRLLGQIGAVWVLSDNEKGWTALREIESPEERVKILIAITEENKSLPVEKAKNILEQAEAEALQIGEANKKIKLLLEIGTAWKYYNKQKSREIFYHAQQVAGQVGLSH